ncbi:DUF349 domain-containing protein [Polaribacter tangerinus]|nr:DUF349 domain-containing protein [Polaribacter tangerinus]
MLDTNEENVEKTVPKSEDTNLDHAKASNKSTKEAEKEAEITADKAVEEVEQSVAEDAENEAEIEDNSVDYASMSLEDLVALLQKIISNNPVHRVKNQVENIKSAFNKKFGALLAEKKRIFLEEGGNSIDFQFSSPVKITYNQLLSDYKKQRDSYYKNLENQLNDNLEKRLQVIEQLKDLIENAEPATMYKQFKELQNTWSTIGPVSKTKYNDTWKIYHHHVERFYDLLHLSNDFRELDFKNNLEKKLAIITQAEALVDAKDINVAFKELQELHKIWKEEIGPVARDVREEVWGKFSEATKKIHDRRHDYFKEQRSKNQDIIEEKLQVVAKLNAYDTSKNKTHRDWQRSMKEVEEIRQEYFKAGKLPYSKSEEIWQQFKKATKKFNSAKNLFYREEKKEQQENLRNKQALLEKAISLKDSEDWDSTTEIFKKIQSDWKKIGHVPRKFSDAIWKEFKNTCNFYFDRLHNQKNAISKEQQDIVDAKKAFLESLKEIASPTKEVVLQAMEDWKNLGVLPRNVRHLEGKFNKQIDNLLEGLNVSKEEVEMLKFTNLIDGLLANGDVRRLDSEQLSVRKKIDEIVREMQQLENNLGFFSNAKDDNPLVVNVKNSIDAFKRDLKVWKKKLKYIKKLDY